MIVTQRQRPDVHRRDAVQPDSERHADPAGRQRPRSRRASSARTSARSISRIARCRTTRGGRSACSTSCRTPGGGAFTYLGSRGRNLPVVRAINNIPIAVPVDVADAGRRPRNAAGAERDEPVRGPDAGQRVQRRHRRAQPAAAAVSRSSERSRSSSTTGRIGTTRCRCSSTSASEAATRSRCSTRARRLRDKLNYLNPADNILEDRVSPNDRPNRFSIGASLQLPFGRDGIWGKDWNDVAGRDPRRLAR